MVITMKERIIQFGTGNFLRGFADFFIHELNAAGLFSGKVVTVKPTESDIGHIINEQGGSYNLYLRGIKDGEAVCLHREITSISRCVDPFSDFDGYMKLAENPDFRFIISNTTEAGIEFDPSCRPEDAPARSFPGKLTQLLYRRFSLGLNGFILLPCELIDNNGGELRACVLKYAEAWELGDEFIAWIKEKNTFASTLVDRIVTGYPKEEAEQLFAELGKEDRLLDTGEIFHLWVIEGNFEDELPLRRAGFNVIWTDDVTPYKKMKVRVLNGAHTSTVFPAMLAGIETVGDCMNDGLLSVFLKHNLDNCILPVLDGGKEAEEFAAAVTDRFKNPYIRHLWSSISLNSVSKFSVRVLPTVQGFADKYGRVPRSLALSLAALICYYKGFEPSDSPSAVEYIKAHAVPDILASAELWGQDISFMSDEVTLCIEKIEKDGIREAIKWAIS